VANISIHDIIYEWFNYVLKDSARPAMLKDRINFELMDANEWKHVPSLKNMSNDTLRFYLDNKVRGSDHVLNTVKPRASAFVSQQVDFADRNSQNSYYRAYRVIHDSLDAGNGIVYVSDAVKSTFSITGAFAGEIKAAINKKDMDFSITLYELKPGGKYFYLSYFMGRASYAWNASKRRLLIPGKIESIPFTNSYITAKKISTGSRLVVVVNINKSPFEQINYGTGKDVSTESIKDAGRLQVKWYNQSIIKIPVTCDNVKGKVF
jgi:predicted acyl esterase